MPRQVRELTMRALNRSSRAMRGARVVLLGVAYKKDVADYRESPVFKIMELLEEDGAEVVCVDPHIASFESHSGRVYQTAPLTDALLQSCDCAVVVTGHSAFDYGRIVALAPAVVDTRNATRGVREGRAKIVLL